MQDKLAATLATSFTERIRHSFAVRAVNGLVDWDTDEAMLRAKPADLTHGFPPGGAAPLCNLLAADGFEFLNQLLQSPQTG
jgi:hypothetical protein